MKHILKMMFSGTLVLLTCVIVIIVTVMFVGNTKTNGNPTTTARTTTAAITSLTSPSASTTRQTDNRTIPTSSVPIASSWSTTAAMSLPTTVNTSLFATSVSSLLTRQSETICLLGSCTDGGNFYQAFVVNVTVTGFYVIYSRSNLDTYASLYRTLFNPRYPSINWIMNDDDTYGNSQYQLTARLTANFRYILVSTTYFESTTGPFAVVATGPGPIILTPIHVSTTGTGLIFEKNISMTISANSSRFCPLSFCASPTYYYRTVIFDISTSGIYNIWSINSTIDTIGFLYVANFTPLDITENLITSDDDSGGGNQFFLQASLAVGMRYILVATTYLASTFGSVFVIISGPGNINIIN